MFRRADRETAFTPSLAPTPAPSLSRIPVPSRCGRAAMHTGSMRPRTTLTVTSKSTIAETLHRDPAKEPLAFQHPRAISNSSTTVKNSAAIDVRGQQASFGIAAFADDGSIHIVNSGDVNVQSDTREAYGLNAVNRFSPLTIVNSGTVTVSSDVFSAAIQTSAFQAPTTITNSGKALAVGPLSYGISAYSEGTNAQVTINNSGSVKGDTAGIRIGAYGTTAPQATILNSGDIGASSNLAIKVEDVPIDIFNTGTITGFVMLDAADTLHQPGGRCVRGAGDIRLRRLWHGRQRFVRQPARRHGACGDTATRASSIWRPFRTKGLISTVDGGTGDSSSSPTRRAARI